MSEHNPTDTQVDPTADYESALDTEQTEAKSNITITEAAQGYLADLLAKQDTDGIGVRIFVEHPGTPRAECCMAYNQPGEEDSADLKLTYDDFSAFIEAASVPYLEDAVIENPTASDMETFDEKFDLVGNRETGDDTLSGASRTTHGYKR